MHKRRRLDDSDIVDIAEKERDIRTGVASQTCVHIVDVACQTVETAMEGLQQLQQERQRVEDKTTQISGVPISFLL